jgi:hypothetical protein
MRPSSIFLCAVPTAFLEVTYSTEQTERDTMRWVASSLERFRRSASIITTFLIIASIGGWVISMLLPNSHALADAATCLYLVLAVTVKVAIRVSKPTSVGAIRVIEAAAFIGPYSQGLSKSVMH